jgi:hypothetical protein
MNTCYSSRSTRLARLFSFGLLDGPKGSRYQETAGSRRHGPLTISRASTHVTRLIRRVVDLAGAHKHGAILFIAPCALPEATGGFDLSRFATAFINNPG